MSYMPQAMEGNECHHGVKPQPGRYCKCIKTCTLDAASHCASLMIITLRILCYVTYDSS